MSLTFRTSNFTAGGGFAPYGTHGVFAALPAGVVFALQGFEQAITLGNWWVLLVVIAFSLAVYYVAVQLALTTDEVEAAVGDEESTEFPEAFPAA
ncbi:hypothetical protein [Actinacidiphila soli]|uniref:hypothetical protein n=1 Tax=Actinacidiphila soli TaxID=2487275 RepID=UPI0019D02343|nr:hypothetical protein [Actinacidiphila soli]